MFEKLMKVNTEPLKADTFYHIYNRGINRENIFKEETNYSFFLDKFHRHVSPVAGTYAYCLLKNHFHFLIKTRTEDDIRSSFPAKRDVEVSKIIALQFSHFFNSYAQAVNKTYDRTGGLFETPFRRKEITDESYLTAIIYYIHSNPQKHRVVTDFRNYLHSSYSSCLVDKSTKPEKETVLSWFGGRDEFVRLHDDSATSGFQNAEDFND